MGLILLDLKNPDSPLIPPSLPFDVSKLKSVSCNTDVIHVVNTEGHVFSSKLNINEPTREWKPAGLMNHETVDVVSGKSHHVAITGDGQLVTWGKNSQGQLGRGNLGDKGKGRNNKQRNHFFNASIVPSIQRIKVIQVSCGNSHTVCLTKDSNVYAWGSNDCGQIGVEESHVSEFFNVPKLVLENRIGSDLQVSAGGSHTVVFDRRRKTIWCWGSNGFGQLGFGPDIRKQTRPSVFPQLQQIDPMSVQCGENFTAFLTENGKVYMCGRINSQDIPNNEHHQLREINEPGNVTITQIACSSNFNYLVALDSNSRSIYLLGSGRLFDFREHECFTKPILFCGKTFVGIFQPPPDVLQEEMIQVETHNEVVTLDQVFDEINNKDISDEDSKKNLLEKTLTQVNSFDASFISSETNLATRTNSSHEIDLEKAEQFFDKVRCEEYKTCVEKGVTKLLKDISYKKSLQRDSLRVLLILPCCLYKKTAHNYYNQDIAVLLTSLIHHLKSDKRELLKVWLESLPVCFFETYVWIFVKCLGMALNSKTISATNGKAKCPQTIYAAERDCVRLLDMLHTINSYRRHPISHQCFNLHELESVIDMKRDFYFCMKDKKNVKYDEFRFCKYQFLYNVSSKAQLLKLQCQEMMPHQIKFFEYIPKNGIQLEIRRNHLIEDTRQIVTLSKKDLKRKLKIVFIGEMDYAGNGTRQEFFHMAGMKLMNQKFGSFYYEDGATVSWFTKGANIDDLHLIGLLCGLALYNGNLLNVQFPLVLYKKLLNQSVSLEDLAEPQPSVYKSMEDLLNYPYEDVEELFGLDFSIPVELCPNGFDIPVTKENRHEYADKVAQHYLNDVIKPEFQAFQKGFFDGIPKHFIDQFHPDQLAIILEGENEKEYDFKTFEKSTQYYDGYHRDHPTIVIFWNVFHKFELKDKRKFLQFITSTDRIRVHGISDKKFIIRKQELFLSDANDLMPRAFTCDGSLWLPEYRDEEIMDQRLRIAIQDPTGFTTFQ